MVIEVVRIGSKGEMEGGNAIHTVDGEGAGAGAVPLDTLIGTVRPVVAKPALTYVHMLDLCIVF
jgi:hypothetical protein